jgi:hypothetical protein
LRQRFGAHDLLLAAGEHPLRRVGIRAPSLDLPREVRADAPRLAPRSEQIAGVAVASPFVYYDLLSLRWPGLFESAARAAPIPSCTAAWAGTCVPRDEFSSP